MLDDELLRSSCADCPNIALTNCLPWLIASALAWAFSFTSNVRCFLLVSHYNPRRSTSSRPSAGPCYGIGQSFQLSCGDFDINC